MSRGYTIEQRRANHLAQMQRMRQTIFVHPYVLLMPGPKPEACPVHADDYAWVYRVESGFWFEKPLNLTDQCWCHVRAITERELEKIRREGLPKYPGRPVLNADGDPTGRIEYDLAPLRGMR